MQATSYRKNKNDHSLLIRTSPKELRQIANAMEKGFQEVELGRPTWSHKFTSDMATDGGDRITIRIGGDHQKCFEDGALFYNWDKKPKKQLAKARLSIRKRLGL